MFKGENWYEYLTPVMQQLVDQAYYLLDREELTGDDLPDYSFVVFPMAKAYEGFLKKYLYEHKFIDKEAYMSKQFRIGRSLNPDLPVKFRDERWIFDSLEKKHPNLAKKIWLAWKMGRNKIFHFFAGEKSEISLVEARKRVEMFTQVMRLTVEAGMGENGNKA